MPITIENSCDLVSNTITLQKAISLYTKKTWYRINKKKTDGENFVAVIRAKLALSNRISKLCFLNKVLKLQDRRLYFLCCYDRKQNVAVIYQENLEGTMEEFRDIVSVSGDASLSFPQTVFGVHSSALDGAPIHGDGKETNQKKIQGNIINNIKKLCSTLSSNYFVVSICIFWSIYYFYFFCLHVSSPQINIYIVCCLS